MQAPKCGRTGLDTPQPKPRQNDDSQRTARRNGGECRRPPNQQRSNETIRPPANHESTASQKRGTERRRHAITSDQRTTTANPTRPLLAPQEAAAKRQGRTRIACSKRLRRCGAAPSMVPHYFYFAGEWHPCHRPQTAIHGGARHPWRGGPRSIRSYDAGLPARRRRPTAS